MSLPLCCFALFIFSTFDWPGTPAMFVSEVSAGFMYRDSNNYANQVMDTSYGNFQTE